MARRTRKQIRRIRRGTGWASALFVALLVLSAAPAFAHHKADHTQGGGNENAGPSEGDRFSDHDGDADSDENTKYTEDNDTNDGTANNVEDAGDNKHPSGKDRSVENGSSGNQGKSESNPDDSKGPQRFEGARGDDKANGPGGTDLADQDGNNGCGNDDDFDDDNNGWCGKPTSPPTTSVGGGSVTSHGEVIDEVEGEVVSKGSVRSRIDQARPGGTSVLGSVKTAARPVRGEVLPFTGANVLTFLAAGLGLIFLGTLMFLFRPQSN